MAEWDWSVEYDSKDGSLHQSKFVILKSFVLFVLLWEAINGWDEDFFDEIEIWAVNIDGYEFV